MTINAPAAEDVIFHAFRHNSAEDTGGITTVPVI
jgi:hypothetical protein